MLKPPVALRPTCLAWLNRRNHSWSDFNMCLQQKILAKLDMIYLKENLLVTSGKTEQCCAYTVAYKEVKLESQVLFLTLITQPQKWRLMRLSLSHRDYSTECSSDELSAGLWVCLCLPSPQTSPCDCNHVHENKYALSTVSNIYFTKYFCNCKMVCLKWWPVYVFAS